MTATATTTAPTSSRSLPSTSPAPVGCSPSATVPSAPVEPGLDPAYEAPAAATAEVDALARIDGATGVAALVDGERRRLPARHAAGRELGPERLGGARGACGRGRRARPRPVRRRRRALGRRRADVPLRDRARDRPALVDAWFRLGFGHQHVHAIREPWPAARGARPCRRVSRCAHRRATTSTRSPGRPRAPSAPGAGARSSRSCPCRRSRRPAPSSRQTSTIRASRRSSSSATTLSSGSPQGCADRGLVDAHEPRAVPEAPGSSASPPSCPSIAGFGVGRVLGEAVLAWSRDAGHPCVVTDWRMTNLLSSRAWPRLGFRPTFYRLHRAIA